MRGWLIQRDRGVTSEEYVFALRSGVELRRARRDRVRSLVAAGFAVGMAVFVAWGSGWL